MENCLWERAIFKARFSDSEGSTDPSLSIVPTVIKSPALQDSMKGLAVGSISGNKVFLRFEVFSVALGFHAKTLLKKSMNAQTTGSCFRKKYEKIERGN